MADPERNDEPSDNRFAMSTGVGVAIGTGIGAAVFAVTGDPIWIALGSGLGAAFGAVSSALGHD